MEVWVPRGGSPASRLVEVEVDGDLSIYDPLTSKVHVFNGTASDTWRLCDGQHTAEQVVQVLAQAYGVNEDDIRDDVLSTIGVFVAQDLLCRADGTT